MEVNGCVYIKAGKGRESREEGKGGSNSNTIEEHTHTHGEKLWVDE